MSQALVLIKLGGSLITDKTMPLHAKETLIKRLAHEVAALKKQSPDTDLIVGTGAGSFGHYLVQANGMSKKGSAAGKANSVKQIHDSVAKLNSKFTSKLAAAGVESDTFNGATVCKHSPLIGEALKAGKVVSIYGDILVRGKAYEVLSTEELFELLLEQLADDYEHTSVVFATSVDGVLDTSGSVIPEINNGAHDAIEWRATDGYDVTGGMKQKLTAALRLLKYAKSVQIINGSIEGNIVKSVAGERVGTIVKLGVDTL